MPSKHWTSIQRTLRTSIGITFITVCQSMKIRVLTRKRATRPGFTGRGSCDDKTDDADSDACRRCCPHRADGPGDDTALCLECIRKRTDRALSFEVGGQPV